MKPLTLRTLATRKPPVQMSLQARFHASLALARTNVEKWSKSHRYSAGHVYEVLRGKRIPSAELAQLMESFVAKQLGEARVA